MFRVRRNECHAKTHKTSVKSSMFRDHHHHVLPACRHQRRHACALLEHVAIYENNVAKYHHLWKKTTISAHVYIWGSTTIRKRYIHVYELQKVLKNIDHANTRRRKKTKRILKSTHDLREICFAARICASENTHIGRRANNVLRISTRNVPCRAHARGDAVSVPCSSYRSAEKTRRRHDIYTLSAVCRRKRHGFDAWTEYGHAPRRARAQRAGVHASTRGRCKVMFRHDGCCYKAWRLHVWGV